MVSSSITECNIQQMKLRIGDPELKVFTYSNIDSTNEECKRILQKGTHKCLVIADTQSNGRGRAGKSFFSPYGGLYFSIAFPTVDAESVLTCRVGVETVEAIQEACGIRCGIKWVNDLFYKGKKVCGILAEQYNNNTIVGIGINLMPVSIPTELSNIIGFLDFPDIRDQLVENITARILHSSRNRLEIIECYRRYSMIIGKQIICHQGDNSFSALAVGINEFGALEILGPNGRETLSFGEVSIKTNQDNY